MAETFANIYITGDKHGNFYRIKNFCERMHTTKRDLMIILGDAGINFNNNFHEYLVKKELQELPITFFCIQGNHDMRPQHVVKIDKSTFKKTDRKAYHVNDWNKGKVFVETEFPSLLFPQDGEMFDLNGYMTLVCGGAFSPDKEQRLLHHNPWFKDEQPSTRTKHRTEQKIDLWKGKADAVLTHTIPARFIPQLMLPTWKGIDRSTEEWLDTIEKKLKYKRWYAGHFHKDIRIEKLTIMMDNIDLFMNQGNAQNGF